MSAPSDRFAVPPARAGVALALLAAGVALWSALLVLGVAARPAELARLTALSFPVALAVVWSGSRQLETLVRRSGDEGADPRATALAVIAPLSLLPLAAVGRFAPLNSLPLVVGLAVGGTVALRASAALPRPLEARARRRLERLGLALIVLPGLALLQTTIVHDAFQYHATAVSLLLDRDLELFDELFLHNGYRSYNPYAEGSIRYLGVPLLQLPALAVAHGASLFASLRGSPFAVNGFSLPYHVAVALSSSLAGVVGIALTHRWVARRVGSRIALAAVALMTWASAVPFFTFLWHGWTHGYALCAIAAFLLLRDRLTEPAAGADGPGWLSLGLLGGLSCLIWPVNGLIFALPAVDLALRARRGGDELRRAVASGGLVALGALVGFAPQLAGWHAATGSWLAPTYGLVGDRFRWADPALAGILFSGARHGLLTWHPIWAPALLGLVWVRDRTLGAALLGWVALHLYAMSSWSVWWTGIGFGNRFFLGLAPVATLGLAHVLRRAVGGTLSPGRRRLRVAATATVAIALVLANLALLAAYRNDQIPMGVKGPELVQDPPPGALEVARMLFVEHPPDGDALTRDLGVNQTLLSSRLRLLWAGASGAARWGGTLLLAALFAAAWVAGLYVASRSRFRSRGVAAGLGAGLVAASLALLAAGPGDRQHRFTRLDPGDRMIEGGQSVELVPRATLRPVASIDLVSFLTEAYHVPQGRAVARIRIELMDGSRVDASLRAGIDTAELGAHREEGRELLEHDATALPVAHEWITRAYSEWYYPAHTYLARIPLPALARVARIEIEVLPGVGHLTVRDVFLREP